MHQKNIDSLNILQRAKAPTPKFFRRLRVVGLTMAAIAGAIFAAPIAVPVVVTTIAGYVAVAGGVVTAVSQVAVES